MPDQRGFNHSSKPAGASSYNISFLAGDIAALIGKVAGGKPVHVVGHDWGGPVAWCVAGWYPQLVKTLSIINGPHPSVFARLLRTNKDQQNRSSYMLYFDTPEADLMDPSTLFGGDAWFDDQTKAAYKAAYMVKGARDSSLNW